MKELLKIGTNLEENTCSNKLAFSSFMLNKVSRTFALNINVLSGKLRDEMLLAYVFCRIADTIEDEPKLNASEKDVLLNLFANIFKDTSNYDQNIKNFINSIPQEWKESKDNWEYILCANCQWCFDVFLEFSEKIIAITAATVIEMCKGMVRFSHKLEQAGDWMAIQTIAELDEYCYFVAGIVGNLVTEFFDFHSTLINKKTHTKLKSLSISFGLALQITNILKDAMEDSTRGICFLPEELAHKYDTTTKDMFLDKNHAKAKKVIQELIIKSWKHLDDAIEYSLSLPRLEPKMRLFCLWPMLMSAETLAAIGDGDKSFDLKNKIKITRPQVKSIISKSSARCWSNTLTKRYYNSIKKKAKLNFANIGG